MRCNKENAAMQQENYEKYIKSALWTEKKRLFRMTRDWPICFKCGAWDVPMDVHHLTYARFGGDELMEDLEYVCRPCHNEIHKYAHIKRLVRKASPKSASKARRRKREKQRKKEKEAARLKRVADYLAKTAQA